MIRCVSLMCLASGVPSGMPGLTLPIHPLVIDAGFDFKLFIVPPQGMLFIQTLPLVKSFGFNFLFRLLFLLSRSTDVFRSAVGLVSFPGGFRYAPSRISI